MQRTFILGFLFLALLMVVTGVFIVTSGIVLNTWQYVLWSILSGFIGGGCVVLFSES